MSRSLHIQPFLPPSLPRSSAYNPFHADTRIQYISRRTRTHSHQSLSVRRSRRLPWQSSPGCRPQVVNQTISGSHRDIRANCPRAAHLTSSSWRWRRNLHFFSTLKTQQQTIVIMEIQQTVVGQFHPRQQQQRHHHLAVIAYLWFSAVWFFNYSPHVEFLMAHVRFLTGHMTPASWIWNCNYTNH